MMPPLHYFVPFGYFLGTRLSKGDAAFHLFFEWLPAAMLAAAFGIGKPGPNLAFAALSYGAFISIYEIGYVMNDYIAARKERDGRARGEQAGSTAIATMIVIRLAAFAAFTSAAAMQTNALWWGYFASLAVVFTLHNVIMDSEMRVITFRWLALLRFMAPIFAILQTGPMLGVAAGAAMVYVGFRELGYMDSKSLLAMPGRKRGRFRLASFVIPLCALPMLAAIPEARPLAGLLAWFALVASAGSLLRR